MCRYWCILRYYKKSYFSTYLTKAIGNVPSAYNDEVKFLLVALYMSGLERQGDELEHVSNATKALANGFDPKKLPKLYKDEIQKLTEGEKGLIFDQCQNVSHGGAIFNFLFPEFSDTVESEYSATVGDGSIAAGYDVGSAEEHDVGISSNILTPPDID